MRIGFIDSGVGGLSVYQQVQQQVAADYIYLMDNKYLPYGEKSESFIQRRLYQLSEHLLELGAELIVIACNTATTQAVEYLRQHFAIPFVGVVPAIKPAAALSQGKGFAVLATPATAGGEYMAELIRQFAPHDSVIKFGSSELVRLAEDKVWYQQDVRQQVSDILSVSPLAEHCSHIVVLGCTHFPFLAEEIKSALPAATVLLETGEAIARRVKQLVGDKLIYKEQYQHCFISTRELNEAQTDRLKQLGFDQHQCWPKPIV
jgi:glutamate racemase